MKKTIFMDKYPVYTLELKKNEIKQQTVNEIIDYFKEKIDTHPIAKFISVFDHYTHTKGLNGKINPDILDAQNIIFCFGSAIPNTKILAARPRSIGVAELKDRFIIEFIEAPKEELHDTMESWAKSLIIKGENKMIAVPVKTNKENPAVTTLFGKAKWFAFIDGDGVTIEKNELQSGRAVVEDFVARGVTQVVFSQMGGNPFMLLQKAKIECFYSGEERILLNDVIAKLNNNQLTKVDGANMADFVEQGSMHNGGGDGEHEHHHDHDHHHK